MAFKVIIVGGGPAGLALAQSLYRANIDYLLLERRDTMIDPGGATITLLPNGMRLMDQFGLWNKSMENSTILSCMDHCGMNGEHLRKMPVFDILQENHGYPISMFSRPNLLKVLSSTLPEPEKHLRTNATVTSVTMSDDGVQVHLADGTTESGSIVVGADGTHSKLRRTLVQNEPSALDGQAGFSTHQFKILYGRSVTIEKMRGTVGTFYFRHDEGWFMQYACEEDTAYWALYERQNGERASGYGNFTQQDVDEMFDKYRDVMYSADLGVTLGEIFDSRVFAWIDWMDEGCAEKWYHRRAVFIGDSSAKPNPSTAEGGNAAIESGAALANELYAVLKKNPSPSLAELHEGFEKYQSYRRVKMNYLFGDAQNFADVEAWPSMMHRVIWRLLGIFFAWRPYLIPDLAISPWTRRSVKLDYVKFDEKKGRMPFIDPRDSARPEVGFFTGLCYFFAALFWWRPS